MEILPGTVKHYFNEFEDARVKQQTGTAFFLIDFLMAFTCIDEMRIMGQNV
jgi:hypothetical protein